MPFCKPAIPELARTWDAPTPPKNGGTTYAYAFLALTFTDITSPPAVDVANHYGTGYPKTYMDGATGGCGGFTMDAYEAPLGITQKSGGKCAITHFEDLPPLTVAGFDPSGYDMVVLMVVTGPTIDCGTSGGMGKSTLTINGASVTVERIFMSVFVAELTATSCPIEYQKGFMCPLRQSQSTYLHENIHWRGFQRHANAFVCLDEPSDTTRCEAKECAVAHP